MLLSDFLQFVDFSPQHFFLEATKPSSGATPLTREANSTKKKQWKRHNELKCCFS